MILINTILLIIALINLLFLLIIINGKRENKFYFIYSIHIISILLWILSMYFYRKDINFLSGYITHLLYGSASIIASTFFYFTYVFPFKKYFQDWKSYLLYGINIVLLILIFFTDKIIKQAFNVDKSEPVIFFGELFYLYFIYIILYFSFAFYNLYRKYNLTIDKDLKKQIKAVSVAYILGSNTSFITNLLLPFIGYFKLNWFGQVTTGVIALIITYSIFEHKLFQIRAAKAELMLALLSILIFIQFMNSRGINFYINFIILLFSILTGMYLIRELVDKLVDLSALEKLKIKIMQKNQVLEDLSRQKTEFISLATHQIRAPITSIKGYTSLFLDGTFGNIPKDQSEIIDIIYNSSNTLSNVVNDYLDVSRIELGQMKYDFIKVSIYDILSECVEEMEPLVSKKGLKLSTKNLRHITELDNTAYLIKSDPNKLKQVILNIIDNAVKYSKAGYIDISLFLANTKTVRIEIKDNGIGIDSKVMPKLFQKFTRAPDANEANINGTGLGLYIAKTIIEDHKGRIWAESNGIGYGTKFIIELKKDF